MTGSSFFDYVHHQDHAEVAEQLGLGLAQGQNLSSPNSAGSEEGVNSSTGTNNPDGKPYFSTRQTERQEHEANLPVDGWHFS
jgi:neuronal PAS domain-containing protein 1/3